MEQLLTSVLSPLLFFILLFVVKAGVAAIALGTQEKYDVKVPIVPIGLTYFRGHRFRGRLVVEFGEPIYITQVRYCANHMNADMHFCFFDLFFCLLSDLFCFCSRLAQFCRRFLNNMERARSSHIKLY